MNTVSSGPTGRISIITATLNVEASIGRLYASLKQQTDGDFEWVVVDGCSRDNTVPMLQKFAGESPWVRFVSEGDNGLYDAINKGIAMATGDYYVVAGADDTFEPDAMADYRAAALRSGADVVLARVIRDSRTIGGFRPDRAWISASKAFPGSHSVGIMFRRALHEQFGLYSREFPLLADGRFLKQLLVSGQVSFEDATFIAGEFSNGGLTTRKQFQLLVENWLIQLQTERSTLLQTLLFLGKLVIRYGAIRRQMRGKPAG